MSIISFVNQKGGVAKTTSCHNIGAELSSCGFKCLLIDMDPQGSLTISLGLKELEENGLTTYEVLCGEDISKAIITRESKYSYDILPTDARLSAYNESNQFKLKEALKKVKNDYDYILIDCPPTLGALTVTSLVASDEIIAPVQTQYLALTGIAQLMETVELVKENLNSSLELRGIIATFYDSRKRLDTEVLESLIEAFDTKVYRTTLSSNTKVAEAPSYGQNIFEYAPTSKGAHQYKALVREILKQDKKKGKK